MKKWYTNIILLDNLTIKHKLIFNDKKSIGILLMNKKPWELNSELKKERIIELANLIVQVRGEVIERHDTTLGDTPLVLGTRNYECCRTRIIEEANQKTWDWLSIVTPKGRFTYAIENTPVRFTRNKPEKLPERKLITSVDTMKQMSLFPDTYQYSTIRWFLVIDTYYKSPADAIYFVGYTNTGEIICKWEVPLEDSVTLLSEINAKKPEPVKINPAPIKIKKAIDKKVLKNDERE